MEAGNVCYARQDDLVIVKLTGHIRYATGDSFHLSTSVNAFLDKLFQKKDFKNILIDLTEAESIDSTNLGLLAKITQFTRQHCGDQAIIVSTNEDINETLDGVGFGQVFHILHEACPVDGGMSAIPDTHEGAADLNATMLQAHRILCDLNTKNREAFKSVVHFLELEADGDS